MSRRPLHHVRGTISRTPRAYGRPSPSPNDPGHLKGCYRGFKGTRARPLGAIFLAANLYQVFPPPLPL
jgi:hypothetical protein